MTWKENFLHKFIKKYDLDNILQEDLSYGFHFRFCLQHLKIDSSNILNKKKYYYMERSYLIKIINMILEILGFKSEVKDYIIFINYNIIINNLVDNDKLTKNYHDEFKLCIIFKKEDRIAILREDKYLFNILDVGNITREEFSKPGNFYTCLEDMFCMISNDDKNINFLANKMSDEELYRYLNEIYLNLKQNFYDKDKIYSSYGGSGDDISCFKYDKYYNIINQLKVPFHADNVLKVNIWAIENDYILERIGEIFTHHCIALVDNINYLRLGRYQYGVMKGYGKYYNLYMHTVLPFILFNTSNIPDSRERKGSSTEEFMLLFNDF